MWPEDIKNTIGKAGPAFYVHEVKPQSIHNARNNCPPSLNPAIRFKIKNVFDKRPETRIF